MTGVIIGHVPMNKPRYRNVGFTSGAMLVAYPKGLSFIRLTPIGGTLRAVRSVWLHKFVPQSPLLKSVNDDRRRELEFQQKPLGIARFYLVMSSEA